jgi:hypothetical protein
MNRDAGSLSTYRHGSSDGWLARLGRAGFLTKGIVYAVIGVLALRAALGTGGSTEGTQGAILEIADQPFGQILLALTALGLFGYALWRIVEATLDPEGVGTDAGGMIKRAAYVVSGISYLGLSVWCAWIVLGNDSDQRSGNSQQEWTAELLNRPFGPWIVGAIGAIIAGVGLYHFYSAYGARFMKHYRTGEMSGTQRRWARRAGRFGLSARGVTFGIIGGFFIQAAIQSDPGEAEGLAGALQTLAEQPYGPLLMGAVALGFVLYGVYCASRARYSRFSNV